MDLSNPPLPIKIPAGKCQNVLLEANADNSGDHAFTLTSTSRWGHPEIDGGDPDQALHDVNKMVGKVVITGTPPRCACTAYGETQLDDPSAPQATAARASSPSAEAVVEEAAPVEVTEEAAPVEVTEEVEVTVEEPVEPEVTEEATE